MKRDFIKEALGSHVKDVVLKSYYISLVRVLSTLYNFKITLILLTVWARLYGNKE